MTFVDKIIIMQVSRKVKEVDGVLKDLTQGSIYKNFFAFGLPSVLAGLLSQSYSIINTAIAGQYLGDAGLAAIGATSPLNTFISSLFWGYGTGFSIYVARLFAIKDYERIKSAVYSSFLFLLVCSLAIGGVLIAFNGPIFTALKIDESLKSEALAYYVVHYLGFFFLGNNATWVAILNAFGIGSYPLFMSLISAVMTVGGNILSIVWLNMGVKGLALSSVLAAAVVFCCYFLKFRKCLKQMGIDHHRTQLGFSYIRNAFPFSLPTMFQQGVMYACTLGISPMVNSIGKEATASYSVANQIYGLNASVYQNSIKAFTNYAAQSFGKGDYHKIKKGMRVGLLQSIAFVAPFILVCCIAHQPVCNLFLNAEASPLTRSYSYRFCSTFLPFICLNIFNNLFHGLYRSAKAVAHLFGSTLFGSISRYAFSLLFIPSMGMNGFFLGWALSWGAECVLNFILYFVGEWKSPEHKAFDRAQKTAA